MRAATPRQTGSTLRRLRTARRSPARSRASPACRSRCWRPPSRSCRSRTPCSPSAGGSQCPMQILVTGAHGKVGAATVHELIEAGHTVTGCDLVPPVYESGSSGASYIQADLTDLGDALTVVRGHDVVIHCAALPEPTRNVPSTVFRNNLMATFNVAEACVRMGADRLVNVSSETVTGMAFAERAFHAPYAQIDEDLVGHPQDAYALAKTFGEQLMDAMVARSDVQAVSLRPSWVQWEGNYERSLGPWLRDPFGSEPSASFWSYIDVYDLAHALRLAPECQLHDWHEAVYVVSG